MMSIVRAWLVVHQLMRPGSALSINPYQQQARRAISYALTAGLILLWAFPVAFVALISNGARPTAVSS